MFRNEDAQGPSHEDEEPNVNGRKGSFKRRHPINHQNGASSSSDEADNAASSTLPSPAQVNGEHSEQSSMNNQDNNDSNSEIKPRLTVRKLSLKNRQRQLEILRRYEAQIRAAQPRSNLQFKGISEAIRFPQRRLQVYSLDLTDLLTSCEVTWNSYASEDMIVPGNGPVELMRYTLNAGNSEIILFGGVNRETEVNVGSSESHDIVSNSIYFISAKKYVI